MIFYTALSLVLIDLVRSTYAESYPFNPRLHTDECTSMEADSIRAQPQKTSKRPFSILVSDNIYHDNDVKVTIKREAMYPIKGLILQARRARCDHRDQSSPVGTFKTDESISLTTANCSGSFDTVINRDWTEVFRNLDVRWNNANHDYSRIYFIATIYTTNNLYWKDVTSEIVRHSTDHEAKGEVCPANRPQRQKDCACETYLTFRLLICCLLIAVKLWP